MWFSLVTLFPAMLGLVRDYGVIGKAIDSELLTLQSMALRDFAVDRHGTVDDRPYGGGAGMVLRPEPLLAAIAASQSAWQSHAPGAAALPVVALTPQGERLTQELLQELAALPGLILLCGRYEGFDQRVLDTAVDRELSIGDYVLSGGELPALVLVDGIARLLPGVLGNSASAEAESHLDALLDFPQYTRPENHPAGGVPEVLLSGDHERIARWRREQALLATFRKRPDLLEARALSPEARQREQRELAELLAREQDEQEQE